LGVDSGIRVSEFGFSAQEAALNNRRYELPMSIVATLIISVIGVATAPAADNGAQRNQQVGATDQGGVVVPTGQLIHEAGRILTEVRRPVDIAVAPDGKTAYVKDSKGVLVIDVPTWTQKSILSPKDGGGSFHGIAVSADGRHVYSTTSGHKMLDITIGADGTADNGIAIVMPGPEGAKDDSYPCGIALSKDGKTAFACLSRNNSLAVVNLTDRSVVTEIPVGVAPYGVALSPDESTAYVTNWGGRRPKAGERTADSAGTLALVDIDGIACSGTVSKVDLAQRKEVAQIAVGLHPADVLLSKNAGTLYVANENSDTISVLKTSSMETIETILVRPDPTLPFASMTNALALSGDGQTLFAANAGNNAVAVIQLGTGDHPKSAVRGFIPAGWYPSALAVVGNQLLITNTKGEGSRGGEAHRVQSYRATITAVDIPNDAQLKNYTAQVMHDARIPESLSAMIRHPKTAQPVPVPRQLGEPSLIDHVVYVLKENRTYDQVFGDMPRGNNDPKLCVFGEKITPNHHAIASQFALLDNYYCCSSLSADGHAWATQAVATDHYEKAFGGFTRSYDTGTDCLAYAPGGFLWDHLLINGVSFRNYGEFDFPSAGGNWADIYKNYLTNAKPFKFKQSIEVEPLRRFSCADYPGWNLKIPDAVRTDVFLKELAEFEQQGKMPNVLLVYLPQDHTSGTGEGSPTPRAMVADNDLAVGRVVEAISKSRFWPTTAIFVNEDDPQAGFDHVDGHRSLCLVASPYCVRGTVVSAFYNQASVIHTIEQIFGVPPMNQFDAAAPLMTECFTSTPDLRPYTVAQNLIALDEMNPKKTALSAPAADDAAWSQAMDWSRPDLNDEDRFNRVLWRSIRGDSAPYPAEFAGAHGKGLKALGLHFDKGVKDDDDD
jgi:YVTN family beta-propeller protein